MVKRLLAIAIAAALMVVLAAGAALAHPVGEPGTPSCFGERISHGSSDHGLTPGDRAELLSANVEAALNDPQTPAELKQLILDLFGDDGVSVKEMTNWVRLNCSDTPIFG